MCAKKFWKKVDEIQKPCEKKNVLENYYEEKKHEATQSFADVLYRYLAARFTATSGTSEQIWQLRGRSQSLAECRICGTQAEPG